VCAVWAANNAVSDARSARRLGHASIGMSIAGIVVSAVIVAAVIVATRSAECHEYNGTCYAHRQYVGDHSYCSGQRVDDFCYYN